MNSADDYGIIRPDGYDGPAFSPTTEASAPDTIGDANVAPSKDGTDKVEDSDRPKNVRVEASGQRAQGNSRQSSQTKEVDRPLETSDLMRSSKMLTVFRDMCELARPEIAAKEAVAGVCKVRFAGVHNFRAWR